MPSLEELIFGYYKIAAEESSIPRLADIFLKSGISSRISPSGTAHIPRREFSAFKNNARGRLRYSVLYEGGLPAYVKGLLRRPGLLIGLFLSIVLSVILSGTVWDVRIDGNERLGEEQVISALRSEGVFVGARISGYDKHELEAGVRSSTPDIAWISVNRRGTVLYVSLIERENIISPEEPSDSPEFSNIVADKDGVITDISVSSGTAMVKIGDVVRRGDILISGVIETESGTVMTRAEGSVMAEQSTEIVTEIPQNYTVRNEKKTSLRIFALKIFNFSVNIFKKYGNPPTYCDIIETEKECVVGENVRLPLAFIRVYYREYEECVLERTENELISEAEKALKEELSALSSAEITALRSSGGFTDSGYRLRTDVVFIGEIGEEREISAE